MITFLLQASACLIAFYLIYYLLLRSNKFFNLQRLYLLVAILSSLVIPFISFGDYHHKAVPQLPAVSGSLTFQELALVVEKPQHESLSLADYLAIAYLVITAFLLIRLFLILFNLLRIIRNGEKTALGSYTLLYTDQPVFIASFFRYIFVQKQLEVEEESLQCMLIHEQKHLKELHFFDLMLLEVTKIVFWFNPIVYGYSKSLKSLHEYVCDNEVIKHTTPEKYERLLIRTWFKKAGLPLVSQFHEISIKNRINMMKKQNKKWYGKLRFLAAIPVAMLLIIACNQENIPTISQERTVSGMVMDDEGSLIPGASIVVEGTNISTITNADGEYEITIPPGDAKNLVYSFNGLNPVSVKIADRERILVKLNSSNGSDESTHGNLPSFHEQQFTFDENRIVKGKITRADGRAMPGVNVVIVGTQRGAITNLSGEYGIQVPDQGGSLAYSFIGFNTEYIDIDSRSVIDVQMSSSGQLGTGEAFLPSGEKKPVKVVGRELDRNGKRFLAGKLTTENDEAVAKASIFVLRDSKIVNLGETKNDGSFEVVLTESDSKVFFRHKGYSLGIRSVGK